VVQPERIPNRERALSYFQRRRGTNRDRTKGGWRGFNPQHSYVFISVKTTQEGFIRALVPVAVSECDLSGFGGADDVVVGHDVPRRREGGRERGEDE